ncbi:MAG: isoleucine--tRNA ligase [Candidatus Babeliaceae bacterium]|nr:isoleucine--tRNA ligase [Candidatus Babeliaceae bacterium]
MNFKDTLNLPKTDFSIRPHAALEDAQLLQRWSEEKLSEKTFTHNAGAKKYILHDGPPYANGHIHLGHAYNKILKDFITKSRRMMGMHVPVTPGWDCHGLPIELKVTQQPENAGLSPLEIKKACRAYAQHWIDVQKQEFKQLGVLMNWGNPYITMSHDYEASIIHALSIFLQQGFIERKNKTVAWCFSCTTTLASAEIEYKDRKDPSLYVRFPLQKSDSARLFPQAGDQQVSLLVWTTTPWTLPLNRGVMAHPRATYQLVDMGGTLLLVGSHVAPALAEFTQHTRTVLAEFDSKLLEGIQVQHPLIPEVTVPIIFDDSVGLHDGTAFVHTAPGAGPIDYEVGVKNNLEIYCPVDAQGRYTAEIKPAALQGMLITDGQIWVIKKLAERGTLFFKNTISHSYPHCWRCHNGLIFRATPQWFVNLMQQDMKQRALQAIEKISFIPERAQNFLKATVENRWEWCISRQRIWGVPIPALICVDCDNVVTSPEFMRAVAVQVAQHGIEYWDSVSLEELATLVDACPGCQKKNFKKEQDILDVWFDSGVSHYAVLEKNPNLAFPADVYCEGVDQHRGWFQSSLLTSLVLEDKACMRQIISHGYTVDEKGRKMSKSLGNVIAPQEIVEKLGTDGLRLWVASVGHDGDLVVSPVVLANVAQVYRKIRNTCRFLLQNLYDFDITRDSVSFDKLLPIDRYALSSLYTLHHKLLKEYKHDNFAGIFHGLADYCVNELSSFYLDIIKDRLYVEQADGVIRRSAQTVLWYILDTLTRDMAPIVSFTAEHLSDYYQKDKTASIHLQSFPELDTFKDFADESVWDFLKSLRSVVLKSLEDQRQQGAIKHSLEAAVTLFVSPSLFNEFPALHDLLNQEKFLKEFFIVSQVHRKPVADNLTESTLKGVYVAAQPAAGSKCPRCWNWDTVIDGRGLCSRCAPLVK